MTAADLPPIDVQRAALLDVLQALAAFGRKRAERRAGMSAEMPAQSTETQQGDHDDQP